MGKSCWWLFLFALIPIFAVLVAWATGFKQVSIVNYEVSYGVSLPWKTLGAGCPTNPDIMIMCIFFTRYDWAYPIADVLFYVIIAYGILTFAILTRKGSSLRRTLGHTLA